MNSGRPLVMGVVNVTPDSFSDGGQWFDPEQAIVHGLALFDEGADIVDVGGESTRPGADEVPEDEELRRVLPVVEALADRGRVSIDTRKPAVARAAVRAGATLVNDISASLWEVAADLGVGWVAMHMQGTPRTMQDHPHYDDVVREVCAFLGERAEAAERAGIAEIWVDPGFGFGKTMEHNLTLLHHLDRVVALGWPVLVGLSRKATLGRLLAASDARAAESGGTNARAAESGRADARAAESGRADARAAESGGTNARAAESGRADARAAESGGTNARAAESGGTSARAAADLASEAALPPVPPLDRLEGLIATQVWALTRGARMVRAHDVRAAVHAAKVVAA